MSLPSIGPERKHLLEVYCKCLKRAERRIVLAGQIANYRPVDLSRYTIWGPMIRHAAKCIQKRGVMGHGSALMKLQIARSRHGAELKALPF